ncbi:MAG TPA: DUF4331 domain-containing protein [Methylomirabilota bacterium]|jgi:hypothetical protein|nr:DUF4331 domain-containing protein [Methylomirabilota bacterium]
MKRARHRSSAHALAGLMILLQLLAVAGSAGAASHREAPLIALDPTADITDVYAFRSWENTDHAVFIMNVIPQQVPASGPNFFNLDDQVLYAFHLDLDQDGKADDLHIEFVTTTEIRNNASPAAPLANFRDLPISYGAVPAITALDGAGSEGLGLRQTYRVRFWGKGPGNLVENLFPRRGVTRDANGRRLVAVTSNVGPQTMPNYESLAAQGVYDLGHGIRVFIGAREETFYIDLGSTFDTLNVRRSPPILTVAQDAIDTANAFGVDDGFEGLNITTIAIEIPTSLLPDTVGMYASTSRQRNRQYRRDGDQTASGDYVQVARLANPLVNEVIIGTGRKDFWNSQDPDDEAQFLGFYLTSRLAIAINAVFGTNFPTANRSDIAGVLLSYFPPIFAGPAGATSDLLRLNLAIAPTAAATQRRLTVLGTGDDGSGNCVSTFPAAMPDLAGWPNGRRPNDDVTDVALRVVAGVLQGPVPCLGDGVNVNIVRPETPNVTPGNNVATIFPFLPTPNPGRSGMPPLNTPFPTEPNEPLFR